MFKNDSNKNDIRKYKSYYKDDQKSKVELNETSVFEKCLAKKINNFVDSLNK